MEEALVARTWISSLEEGSTGPRRRVMLGFEEMREHLKVGGKSMAKPRERIVGSWGRREEGLDMLTL